MAGRIVFYPSVFNPVVPAAVAAAVVSGWACYYPDSTRGPVRQQSQGEFRAPGRFSTTNTTFGGETFSPTGTTARRPQQPPGEILPPGQFSTTNTTPGGDATFPPTTRRVWPQQPPGEVLPPGAFSTVAPSPNTTFGGDTVSPSITRRQILQQPPGEVLPPGQFVTTNTTFGGDIVSPSSTRRFAPQQPPGLTDTPVQPAAVPQGWECLHPPATSKARPVYPPAATDQWPVAALPNTTYGGDCWYPAATRALARQQPPGHTLPDGAFTTTAPPASVPGIIFTDVFPAATFVPSARAVTFTRLSNPVATQSFVLRPTEIRTVTFDFSALAEIVGGESISSIAIQPAAALVQPAGSGLPTVGAGTIVGDTVQALADFTTAADGADYVIKCTIATDGTPPHRLTAGGIVRVRDVGEDS